MSRTRSEQMADFDLSEDARRHRLYIAELRVLRGAAQVHAGKRYSLTGGVTVIRPVPEPTCLARDRVVRAIDALIAEAERAEA